MKEIRGRAMSLFRKRKTIVTIEQLTHCRQKSIADQGPAFQIFREILISQKNTFNRSLFRNVQLASFFIKISDIDYFL